METFTVVAWLWMGQRYEEVRIEQLTRQECMEHAVGIMSDRLRSRATCVSPMGFYWPSRPPKLRLQARP